MKKISWLVLIFAGATMSLSAVEVGDTYRKVIEEKGAPMSKMEAGDSTILRYVDATIKLTEGKVVSITASGKGAASGKRDAQKSKLADGLGQ